MADIDKNQGNANEITLIELFSTPVMVFHPAQGNNDLHQALTQLILDKEQTSDGQLRSNVNGWQSERDLLTWPEEEILTLRNIFVEGFGMMAARSTNQSPTNISVSFEMTAWANVIRNGAYNMPHNHPGYNLSAVYYVSVGSPMDAMAHNGSIQFLDPRVNAGIIPSEDKSTQPREVKPETGMLLVFPSWLMHFVHPFTGDGERISIPCNAIVKSYSLIDPSIQPS